jgi:hypothetical protein
VMMIGMRYRWSPQMLHKIMTDGMHSRLPSYLQVMASTTQLLWLQLM